MLYYIFRWLDQFGISGSHLWGYISFRAIMAMILALIISAWFGERFIKYLKRKQITEVQRDASIDPFGVKDRSPINGRYYYYSCIDYSCIIVGTLTQHLSYSDGYYHNLARISRWNGRFYKDIPT